MHHHSLLNSDKMRCIVIVCIIGLTQCSADYFTSNPDNFESVPTTIKTYENDTVLLPCYTVEPYQFIRWFRDEVLIVDSRDPEFLPPPRITFNTNGSLVVSNVRINDTAEYQCEVMTPNSALEKQLHAIEVQYPSSVISTPSGRIEIALGSVFEIVCEARGIPHPVISWHISGQPNTNRLENIRRRVIEVNDRQMAGKVECIATNGVGRPATAGVDMIVQFTPEIKSVSNTVHTKLSSNVQLECIVVAQPRANVHWFHHGVPVNQNSRISFRSHAILINQTVNEYFTESKHELHIHNIRDTDFGTYICRAENVIGMKDASVELTGRPTTPIFKRSPTQSTHNAHGLIWQTESLSPIFEHKLKFRQVPSGNITPGNRRSLGGWIEIIVPADESEGPIHTAGYTLKGLMPASVYEVAVVSRNRFGWSDSSKIIRFATSGEIELPNYSTESTEEQFTKEDENYYDESSSSDLDSEQTEDFDSYGMNSIEPYHSHGTRATSQCFIIFMSIVFYGYFQ